MSRLSGGGRHRAASVRTRRWVAWGGAAVLAAGMLGIGAVPAFGSTVAGASFGGGAGTVTVGGKLYAKSGGTLTLSVTTSSDTQCVDVTGALSGHQTSATAKTSWALPFTAGAGDGTQTVT